MKTKSEPSRYRYCISRRSTVATSTLTPALKVRSTTLPEAMFFSLVRTKAPPLPGLTCWNSTTVQSPPSRFSVMPFFRSLVVATFASPGQCISTSVHLKFSASQVQWNSRSEHEKFSRSRREQARPVGPHDKDVLDPYTAPAGQVDTRLDGDRDPVG